MNSIIMKQNMYYAILLVFAINYVLYAKIRAQETNNELDQKVKSYLENNPGTYSNMNVPEIDGKFLHDLILENNYKKALEIGTSTGYSSIWIAWALSKTGGKLITIEIHEGRYKQALKNFKEAGVDEFIDARLADAHELVKELEGPFDFVFSDADKNWYEQYFQDIDPKLMNGGCYTSHNVSASGYLSDYYRFLNNQPNYETSLFTKGRGIAVSYKKGEK